MRLQKLRNFKHLLEAYREQILTGFPAKKLTIIGVTGTDGKTTTSTLIHHILTQAGIKSGISSTLASPHTTTPGRGAVHRFLAQCVRNKCTHAVVEVTSIGIDQNRLAGIKFSLGVLTNIANNEHLDYHGNFQNYKKVKLKFLLSCQTIVANADDPSINDLKKLVKKPNLITYGIKNNADITPDSLKFHSNLVGKFNTYNILAAIAAARTLGLSDSLINQAIATFEPPPGRLEFVLKTPYTVIVDFAHTPQAFEQVLPVAKSLLRKQSNKLIHVFGATGSRDQSKRPLMAEIASKYDDFIFLTHEDTYFEDKNKIIKEIEKGLTASWFSKYQIIPDRREAIRRALNLAGPGDVVLLTGVGHQKSMNLGGKELPWSESKVVLELLSHRHKKVGVMRRRKFRRKT